MRTACLIFLALAFEAATANPYVDLIDKVCSQTTEQAMAGSSQELNALQDRFRDQEARVKNRNAFVAALDEVIAHSEFAYIGNCRQEIAKHGYSYRLKFQNPNLGDQAMFVELNGHNVILSFNLTKSVQRVLFVYLHEMTHVCQIPERESLTSPADYARFRVYGEIQAFYNMQLAYRSFINNSPRFCRAEGTGSDSKDSPLSESYRVSELQLEAGDFAQGIVYGYLDDYAKYKGKLIDLKSAPHTYGDPQDPESKFQLKSLTPRMKSLISRLPILVIEN